MSPVKSRGVLTLISEPSKSKSTEVLSLNPRIAGIPCHLGDHHAAPVDAFPMTPFQSNTNIL
uniref:Uncharacterized protein n=1 Tax=Rhizophora mucronata TaxID=61149 RepID=A0A2P2IHB6_RHIMU